MILNKIHEHDGYHGMKQHFEGKEFVKLGSGFVAFKDENEMKNFGPNWDNKWYFYKHDKLWLPN